ncbi:MAG TPA: 4'-phosphopantetheinyl transferase superfamily protein [Rhodanobacter sp.]|nr:4'-phosphopantetheinyl transferase superfamily protein [Rhodanobacter sp.]
MHEADGFRTTKVAEPLGADEIHVWRLARPKGAKRAPLQDLLARYLAVDAASVELVAGAHGRPRLAGVLAGALDFNWSHSGELALVALARGIAPGIDVEQLRTRASALDIAERFFTAAEAAWLRTLAGERQQRAFFELWTAREAVLKADGRGIAFGLDHLAFAATPRGMRLDRLDGDDPDAWQVEPVAVGAAAVATLAWRGEPRRVRRFTLAE